MKFDYKDIFEQTRQFVNELDPCSFINSGAPDDEYDALTNKILNGIINQKEESEIRKEIIELLDNYYGTPVYYELSAENQERLRNDIIELIERLRKTNANTQ